MRKALVAAGLALAMAFAGPADAEATARGLGRRVAKIVLPFLGILREVLPAIAPGEKP